MSMKFYLLAAAIGSGLAMMWLAWLFAARAYLRTARPLPAALVSIIQVAIVLVLMLAGYHASDWCFAIMKINPADAPAAMVTFRRIWIIIWGLGMVASIQIFLDIRNMASAPPAPTARPARPGKRRR